MPVNQEDFSFILVDDDDNQHDVSAHLVAFRFEHGARANRLTPPQFLISRGSMVLNNAGDDYSEADAASYKHLIIKTSGFTYFHLDVIDFDFRDIQLPQLVIKVAGHLSSRRNDGISFSNRPTSTSGTPLDKAIISQSFGYASYGPMWGFEIPGSYELVGSIPTPAIEYNTVSLIRAFERTMLALFMERCRKASPELFVTRLPLDMTGNAIATYRASNTILLRKGYRDWSTVAWQANRWDVLLQGNAWQIRETQRASFRFKMGKRNPFNPTWQQLNQFNKQIFGGNLDAAEWGGFVAGQHVTVRGRNDGRVISGSGQPITGVWKYSSTSTAYYANWSISSDGNSLNTSVYTILSSQWATVTIPQGIKYYKTANLRPPGSRLFTTAEDTKSKRVLPRNQISLLNEGPLAGFDNSDTSGTYTKINAALDAWATWDARCVSIALISESLDEGMARSICQKQPGDIINLVVEDVDHRCVILNVGWEFQELRPLIVSWLCVTLGPRTQLAPSTLLNVTLNGQPVELNGEQVRLTPNIEPFELNDEPLRLSA